MAEKFDIMGLISNQIMDFNLLKSMQQGSNEHIQKCHQTYRT